MKLMDTFDNAKSNLLFLLIHFIETRHPGTDKKFVRHIFGRSQKPIIPSIYVCFHLLLTMRERMFVLYSYQQAMMLLLSISATVTETLSIPTGDVMWKKICMIVISWCFSQLNLFAEWNAWTNLDIFVNWYLLIVSSIDRVVVNTSKG